MTIRETNRFATQLALGTFCLGTFCFILFAVSPNSGQTLMLCVIFLLVALFINGIMMLLLLYDYFTNPFDRQEILVRVFLMLCNIPVAVFYLFILIEYILKQPF